MSYLKTTTYKILPRGSYKIIRNCSGCGSKSTYQNTEHFRVNANGSQIDVWLIYQCEKCRHTYNLTVYERVKPTAIPVDEYPLFLANDSDLALKYGTDRKLFSANKAEIDGNDIEYELIPEETSEQHSKIIINNPYELKLRTYKILVELLGITRSKVRQLEKDGIIDYEQKYLSRQIEITINDIDNYTNNQEN